MRGSRDRVTLVFRITALSLFLLPSLSAAQPLFDEPSSEYEVNLAFLCETADFNCDDLEDFAVIGYDPNSINIFLSEGDGTFTLTPFSVDFLPASISVGNFNSDPYPDVIVGEGSQGDSIRVFPGDGSGGLQMGEVMTIGHFSVNTGDLDGDGDSDLLLPNSSYSDTDPFDRYLHVLLCDGNGHFDPDSIYTVEGPPIEHLVYIPGDLNDDGFADVAFIPSTGYRLGIMPGNGDGTLQPVYFSGSSYGFCLEWSTMAAGDFNEDGYLDLATTSGGSMSAQDIVYVNDGSGLFITSDSLGKVMQWVLARDFDLDGHLDLGSSYGGIRIYPGLGDGTFGDFICSIYPTDGQLGSADFDNDGDPDLVRLNDGMVYVYLNNTITQGIGEEEGTAQPTLLSASPSPFSTSLSVSARNCTSGETVKVFDLYGREVAQLPVGGTGFVQWDGVSSGGAEVPCGVYVLRLSGEAPSVPVMVLKL